MIYFSTQNILVISYKNVYDGINSCNFNIIDENQKYYFSLQRKKMFNNRFISFIKYKFFLLNEFLLLHD